MRVYTVESSKVVNTWGRTEEDTIYAGVDADEAFGVANDERGKREVKEAFIHVWEDGEHLVCTRDHPDSLEVL